MRKSASQSDHHWHELLITPAFFGGSPSKFEPSKFDCTLLLHNSHHNNQLEITL